MSEEQQEPRFSGAPAVPSPEVFERARGNNPAWVQVLSNAYEQFAARPENAGLYADPQKGGATIAQIWRMFTLFGTQAYCLLARPLPANSTREISRLVKCTAAEAIRSLKSIQAANGSIGLTVAYHDGQTGHCIVVETYEPARDRFVYMDPWPERSLLAKENNIAGVEAQPEGKRWSVTAAELERVLFAAFVFPAQWARLQGEQFDLSYDDWKKSEFFQFFHLRQFDERPEAGHITRILAPQAFPDQMAILVGCRQSGKIVKAALRVGSEWVANNFLLALDLVKGFIMAFAPAPDRDTYAEIATAFWSLRDPQFLLQAKDADPNASQAMRCVHAFMGAPEKAVVTTDFASLSVGTTHDAGGTMQYLDFDLT
jgi:hypothetical protein